MFVCCLPVYLSVKLKISVTTETIEVFSTGTGVILSFFLGRSGLLEDKGGVTVDKHREVIKIYKKNSTCTKPFQITLKIALRYCQSCHLRND